MVSRERRAGAAESWAAKHPRLARMSSHADIRAEGEKVTGSRAPFSTLYGRSVLGWIVGLTIAFCAINYAVLMWRRHGTGLVVVAALLVAAVIALVLLVRRLRSPYRVPRMRRFL